jgi:hypothetical protein
MSTIVVETAAAAESLDSTGESPEVLTIPWADTTNALTDNALSASVDFDGTSDSSDLWLHNFGYSIPTTEVVVEGIAAKVIRTGTGSTEDLQVVLTYGPLDATTGFPEFTTSKHQTGLWADDVDDTANYGGASDIWNRMWTGAEINSTDFGFALSAESPISLDTALVDFVELTLYYHRQYDITPSGGTLAGVVSLQAVMERSQIQKYLLAAQLVVDLPILFTTSISQTAAVYLAERLQNSPYAYHPLQAAA